MENAAPPATLTLSHDLRWSLTADAADPTVLHMAQYRSNAADSEGSIELGANDLPHIRTKTLDDEDDLGDNGPEVVATDLEVDVGATLKIGDVPEPLGQMGRRLDAPDAHASVFELVLSRRIDPKRTFSLAEVREIME